MDEGEQSSLLLTSFEAPNTLSSTSSSTSASFHGANALTFFSGFRGASALILVVDHSLGPHDGLRRAHTVIPGHGCRIRFRIRNRFCERSFAPPFCAHAVTFLDGHDASGLEPQGERQISPTRHRSVVGGTVLPRPSSMPRRSCSTSAAGFPHAAPVCGRGSANVCRCIRRRVTSSASWSRYLTSYSQGEVGARMPLRCVVPAAPTGLQLSSPCDPAGDILVSLRFARSARRLDAR